MTTSQESSRKFSLEMKSEVHYKKAAKSYRKSKQYINMCRKIINKFYFEENYDIAAWNNIFLKINSDNI